MLLFQEADVVQQRDARAALCSLAAYFFSAEERCDAGFLKAFPRIPERQTLSKESDVQKSLTFGT